MQPATASTKGKGEDADKKRLRNRLAQRAFRRRQADHLRAKQSHANSKDQPHDVTIRNLRAENSALRKTLIEVETKLARFTANIQSLSATVSGALADPSPEGFLEDSTHSHHDLADEPPISKESLSSTSQVLSSGIDSATDHSLIDLDLTAMPGTDLARKPSIQPIDDCSPDLNLVETFDNLAQQIPSLWSFEYQMGPDSYANALTRSQDSSIALGRGWTDSNSPFSDHIQVLQRLMNQKMRYMMPLSGIKLNLFYQEVLMILALFNSMTRPDVMRWYAKTRFYHIVNLTAWQVYPCPQTFDSIHPQYKSTELQLQRHYPTVIDWIPFPSIRNRLIRLHAANPKIDQIFCDVVSSYVVETSMSELISGAPSIKAYIRVTDLAAKIDVSASSSSSHVDCDAAFSVSLPAPDLATLFASPEYCQVAFNYLNMNRGVSHYKIDPALFATYPELYDPDANVSAEGIPLRPDVQASLTYPVPLDAQTFQTYRNFIDYSHDWSFVISGDLG
ncbi:uncharacterized protein LDX57_002324 [Aspergillus melleus]|uniref:uncharacterized protein n=1 Tax=Aspergillus melleus TaxID=138277 RepID=UPI001E8E1F91|nr:uncharacterized protein LDX57_002324 [Aspergillus melleus]KAH8424577.1 hypothetical protein LDX57_002324 [Aspergillus melleus]